MLISLLGRKTQFGLQRDYSSKRNPVRHLYFGSVDLGLMMTEDYSSFQKAVERQSCKLITGLCLASSRT